MILNSNNSNFSLKCKKIYSFKFIICQSLHTVIAESSINLKGNRARIIVLINTVNECQKLPKKSLHTKCLHEVYICEPLKKLLRINI